MAASGLKKAGEIGEAYDGCAEEEAKQLCL